MNACMHACMSACLPVCLSVCLRACVRDACLCVCVCVCTCMRASQRACVRACMRAFVHACVRPCVCVCARACARSENKLPGFLSVFVCFQSLKATVLLALNCVLSWCQFPFVIFVYNRIYSIQCRFYEYLCIKSVLLPHGREGWLDANRPKIVSTTLVN